MQHSVHTALRLGSNAKKQDALRHILDLTDEFSHQASPSISFFSPNGVSILYFTCIYAL